MLQVLSWSEVWALLIPLITLYFKRRQPAYLSPVVKYVYIAFAINLFADIIDRYLFQFKFSGLLTNNIYLYNIHSIVRLLCFSYFFILLKQPFLTATKKYLVAVFVLFVIINFCFEKFFGSANISSRLFAAEAGILLFYCLQYYLFKLQEDDNESKKEKDFWIVMGLSIFVVFNFSFFLLYTFLKTNDQIQWWYLHNVSYIILCIFIAKAFYVSGNRY